MTNSVTFYKVPWTNSSLNQPYFMTENDRDSYLQDNCYPFVVLQRVNINLLTDMNVELKVPIDITVAQEYNFCKIEYNEKKYFACIIDYSQISVNRTYIYAKRHILTEIVNYLSNFENFNISTATLNDSLIYKKNAKFYKPEFRSYKKVNFTEWTMVRHEAQSSGIGGNIIASYDVEYQDFLIIYSTHNADQLINFYGKPVQFGVVFIPLRAFVDDNIRYECVTINSNEEQWNELQNFHADFKKIPIIDFLNYLNTTSPYIIGYKYIKLPVGKTATRYTYVMPFYFSAVIGEPKNPFGMTMISTSYIFTDIVDTFYYSTYNFNFLFGNLEIKLTNNDTSIIIDKSDYTVDNSSGIDIKYTIFFNPNDDELFICIQPNKDGAIMPYYAEDIDNSQFDNSIFRTSFEIGSATTLILNSSANFDAQNRYYDAMTKSVRNQKIAGAWSQGIQNILIGGAEIGFSAATGGVSTAMRQVAIPSKAKMGYSKVTLHSEYSRGANTAGESLGVGNIIRGVGSIVDGYIDSHFYEEQRELNAKNERAKPDTLIGGGSGDIRCFDSRLCFYFIEEIPFENDYEIWQQNVERFGISCEIFSNEIDLNDYIKNNHFAIQAVAEMKSTVLLNCVEYDALYEVLTGGCRYFIVGTVPTSNSNLLEEEVSNES